MPRMNRTTNLMNRLVYLSILFLLSDGSCWASSIHEAARNGELLELRTLVGRGQPVDKKDEYGFAPLDYAARNGHLAVVRFLVAKGAQLDQRDNLAGGTALHRAAFGGHDHVVRFLVESGADINAPTTIDGYLPLDVAILRGGPGVTAMLMAYDAERRAGTLYVEIGLNQAGDVLIDNLEYQDIADCTVNLTGGFSVKTSRIGARDQLILPADAFKREDGTPYQPTTYRPKNMEVTCLFPEERTSARR